jgi:RNA polymerase-binding protein DksA
MAGTRTKGSAPTRQRLEAERDRLEGVRAALADDIDADHQQAAGESSAAATHPADVGTELFEREKDLSILEQVEARLEDVGRALRRLDEGTYGTCEVCGEPIGPERLAALPAATLCVRDQARAERAAVGG